MAYYETIRFWGNVGRSALLFMSAVAVITGFIWNYTCRHAPFSTLEKEERLVKKYYDHYEKRLNDALTQLNSDSNEKYGKMIEFLNKLESVKKMDRLDPLKRQGLQTVTGVFEADKAYEEALFWAEKWIEFDDRDLFAVVQKARILCRMKGRTEEGRSLLASLYQKFPEVELVVRAYGEMLFHEKNFADAFLSYYRLIEFQNRLEKWGWEIYWDKGDGFNANHKKSIFPEKKEDGAIRISLKLKEGIRQLRIDPFLLSNRIMLNPSMIFVREGMTEKINLPGCSIRFNDMRLKENLFVITGDRDPFFSFDLPEKFQTVPFQLIFQCKTGVDYPDFIKEISCLPDRESVKEDILKKGGEHAVAFFESLREADITGQLKDQGAAR